MKFTPVNNKKNPLNIGHTYDLTLYCKHSSNLHTFFMSDKEIEDEISRRVAEACERIIQKIGFDLHDVAIQKAFLCSMDFHILKKSITDAELHAVLIRLEANFKDLTQAMRSVSLRTLALGKESDTH